MTIQVWRINHFFRLFLPIFFFFFSFAPFSLFFCYEKFPKSKEVDGQENCFLETFLKRVNWEINKMEQIRNVREEILRHEQRRSQNIILNSPGPAGTKRPVSLQDFHEHSKGEGWLAAVVVVVLEILFRKCCQCFWSGGLSNRNE
jgi:hypothetical protein